MPPDPIVEEIHEIRRQLSASFGYDIHAIAEDARQRDAEDDRPVMRRPPRRPAKSPRGVQEKETTPSDQTRRELLEALAHLGNIHPEWRLGQTLANLAMMADRMEASAVWDLEDEEALAAARTLIEKYSEVGSDVA